MYFLVNIQLGVRKKLCGLWWQEGPAGGFGQFPFPLGASAWTSKMGLLKDVVAGILSRSLCITEMVVVSGVTRGKGCSGMLVRLAHITRSPHNTGFRATSVSVAAWQISHTGNSAVLPNPMNWVIFRFRVKQTLQFIFRS